MFYRPFGFQINPVNRQERNSRIDKVATNEVLLDPIHWSKRSGLQLETSRVRSFAAPHSPITSRRHALAAEACRLHLFFYF